MAELALVAALHDVALVVAVDEVFRVAAGGEAALGPRL